MAKVKYSPDKRGLKSVAQSSGIQGVALGAAQALASRAQSDDPTGGYTAIPSVVSAGWDNELRAGAAVVETNRGMGARRRTLARIAEGS